MTELPMTHDNVHILLAGNLGTHKIAADLIDDCLRWCKIVGHCDSATVNDYLAEAFNQGEISQNQRSGYWHAGPAKEEE